MKIWREKNQRTNAGNGKITGRKCRKVWISLLLCIFMMAGSLTAQAAYLDAAKIKNAANARIGGGYPAGYCLSFVESVYQSLGVKRPYDCCATSSYRHYVKSNSMKSIPVGATVYFMGSATPCSTCGSSRCGHVGIYVGNGQFVHSINGSVIRSSMSSYRYQFRGWGYCGNFRIKSGKAPKGKLESVTAGDGKITVKGWAYDPDKEKESLTIEVYVGGAAGSGAKKVKLKASKSRPDIGAKYNGIGNLHGFSGDVGTTKTGKQTVYVYAVDMDGGQPNKLLGKQTVTIKKDKKAPVISDIQISNIDKNGYTVSCRVTDNGKIDRVQFPSWTEKNGKDDLEKNWKTSKKLAGKKKGNTYSFRVNTSAHDYAGGIYCTQIYAWDDTGNMAKAAAVKADVPRPEKPSVTASVYVKNKKWSSYVKQGKTAGAAGSGKQLEGIRFKLSGKWKKSGLFCRVYSKKKGWGAWSEPGSAAGITGKGLGIEGMQLKLSDELAPYYHISYRVKLVGKAWSGWVKDGKTAGKPGKGRAVEAVQVKLIAY